jgi:hypothetical protein
MFSFDAFAAQIDPTNPAINITDSRKNCQMTLEFYYPSGV